MSVDDCPDCRKLDDELKSLSKAYVDATAYIGCLELRLDRIRKETDYRPPDPRAPKPVLVPAAVPKRPMHMPFPERDRWCGICNNFHP